MKWMENMSAEFLFVAYGKIAFFCPVVFIIWILSKRGNNPILSPWLVGDSLKKKKFLISWKYEYTN